jgi:hypothetical protein
MDRKLHPRETQRERVLRRARRTVAGFAADSRWLQIRPFSDKTDGGEEWSSGGYYVGTRGASGESGGRIEPHELPPVPHHPRAGTMVTGRHGRLRGRAFRRRR